MKGSERGEGKGYCGHCFAGARRLWCCMPSLLIEETSKPRKEESGQPRQGPWKYPYWLACMQADDPDAEDVKRTSRREVALLRHLEHPNVVRFVDEFLVRERLFIVMVSLVYLLCCPCGDDVGGRGSSSLCGQKGVWMLFRDLVVRTLAQVQQM